MRDESMAFQPDIFINTPAGRVMVVDANGEVRAAHPR
jgi:hypothetical protein